jgi:hypothetical protein
MMRTLPHDPQLRMLVTAFEQMQTLRVSTGEQLRAVLQGRTTRQIVARTEDGSDKVLAALRRGALADPIPPLGAIYHRLFLEEKSLLVAINAAVEKHPVWSWLQLVRGVGPSLGGRLLARLDPARAPTVSSFWAYCGLATVPGEAYVCPVCGLRQSFPAGYSVSGNHIALGGRRTCSGALVAVAAHVRVAVPRPLRGQALTYDPAAKKICYLIGVSFLRTRSPYELVYRDARATLERERPGWADGRKHLTAMRKTEKLFLSHLWTVWRTETGLPTVAPYVGTLMPRVTLRDPWEFLGVSRPQPEPLKGPSAHEGWLPATTCHGESPWQDRLTGLAHDAPA